MLIPVVTYISRLLFHVAKRVCYVLRGAMMGIIVCFMRFEGLG